MKKNIIAFCSFIVLLFVGGFTSQASEFNFSVEPVIPENQFDKESSYFDLLMEPNQEQTLTVTMRNDTDKTVKVGVDISPATTNINGVVEYSHNKIKPDRTLKHNLADLVEVEKEVSLAPKSNKDLSIKVKMPKEDIEGLIAGGITFEEIVEEEEEKSKSEGLSIKNRFSYVIGFILQTKDTSNLQPDLNLTSAKASQSNARNVIVANLQNPQPVYLNQLAVKATVTKKGSSDVLYSLNSTKMQIAPNSNFNYQVPLNGKELKAGVYTMHVLAHGKEDKNGSYTHPENKGVRYDQEWEFTQDFVIKRDEAKAFNKADVTVKKDYLMYYMMGAIIALLVIILILIAVKRKKK